MRWLAGALAPLVAIAAPVRAEAPRAVLAARETVQVLASEIARLRLPYRRGEIDPSSGAVGSWGLVLWVHAAAGVGLPDHSRDLRAGAMEGVEVDELEVGDVVFLAIARADRRGRLPGVHVGGGEVVAAFPGRRTAKVDLREPRWSKRLRAAARPLGARAMVDP